MNSKLVNILVFLLIYISNDTILFGTNSNSIMICIQYIFIFSVALFLTIKTFKKRKKIRERNLNIFFLIITFTLITFGLNYKFNAKYIYEICLVYIAILFSENVRFKEFKNAFINSMYFFSAYSLVTYCIFNTFKGIINFCPKVINIANYYFGNVIFTCVPANENFSFLYRNFGIFREPGFFSCMILLSVIFLLYSKEKNESLKVFIKIAVFCLTILTTYSTAGIFCLLLILSFYLFLNKKMDLKKIILIIVFIVFLGFIFSSNSFSGRVFGKLKVKNASLNNRINSITANLIIAIKHPFFGVGWEDIKSEFSEVSYKLNGSPLNEEKSFHNTNTFLKFFAVHGIILFGIYLYGVYNSIYKICNQKLISILIFGVIILMFSNEDLTINIVYHLLMIYGYENSLIGLNKKNEV